MSLGPKLVDLVVEIGRRLDFDVATEVEASESAWVDVVWFDKRFSFDALGIVKPKMRFTPVLPVAAFEIEIKTGTDAKHIKGSVSNLDNLGAQMGIIVVGSGNLDLLRKKDVHKNKSDIQLEKILSDRVYRWVYAEFQAKTRIVIMSERQIIEWAKRLGVSIPTGVEA